jgi:hypothetical protein
MRALQFVTAMGLAMNLYWVQEFLAVLLLVAFSTATILAFAVASILFREGIRRAVVWTKTAVIRPGGLRPKGQSARKTDGRSALHFSPKIPIGQIVKKRARFQLTQ